MWIPLPIADYIMVNEALHPMHKTHTVLHEIGHMLLNHPLRPLSEVLPPHLLRELDVEMLEGFARYSPLHGLMQSSVEQEAEAFVFSIQTRIIQADRFKALTAVDSSIKMLLPLIHTSAS